MSCLCVTLEKIIQQGQSAFFLLSVIEEQLLVEETISSLLYSNREPSKV